MAAWNRPLRKNRQFEAVPAEKKILGSKDPSYSRKK